MPFTVPPLPPTRLDVWLLACLMEQDGSTENTHSRASIQRYIKEGFVTRLTPQGPQPEANPARKVRQGEVYEVNIPAARATQLVGEDIPLNIVYEDADLIVLNKPAGLTVHPAPGNATGTLVQALIHHCGKTLSEVNGKTRPGIVHRIDKDTSGLLVIAKTDAAHRGLARQFARHSIHRRYVALVRGTPKPPSGTVQGAIGRHPVHRLKRAVVQSGGKPAITHYRTLQALGPATLVSCQLETGRTHQIRVHMAHIGHPLLGDPLYGTAGPLKGLPELTLPPRQMLHAAELGFIHPTTNTFMQFESPLPEDMEQLIAQLKASC